MFHVQFKIAYSGRTRKLLDLSVLEVFNGFTGFRVWLNKKRSGDAYIFVANVSEGNEEAKIKNRTRKCKIRVDMCVCFGYLYV